MTGSRRRSGGTAALAALALGLLGLVLAPTSGAPLHAQTPDCTIDPAVDSVSIAEAMPYEGRWEIGPTPPGDEVVNDSIIQWMAAGEVAEKLAELEERYAPDPYRIRRDEATGRLLLEGIGRTEVLLPCAEGVFRVGVDTDSGEVEVVPQLRVEFEFDEDGVATGGVIREAERHVGVITRPGGQFPPQLPSLLIPAS